MCALWVEPGQQSLKSEQVFNILLDASSKKVIFCLESPVELLSSTLLTLQLHPDSASFPSFSSQLDQCTVVNMCVFQS